MKINHNPDLSNSRSTRPSPMFTLSRTTAPVIEWKRPLSVFDVRGWNFRTYFYEIEHSSAWIAFHAPILSITGRPRFSWKVISINRDNNVSCCNTTLMFTKDRTTMWWSLTIIRIDTATNIIYHRLGPMRINIIRRYSWFAQLHVAITLLVRLAVTKTSIVVCSSLLVMS